MFLCQKHFELFYLEDKCQIFPPSLVNRLAGYFFWKAIHDLLQLFTYKNISRRVNWFNKLSYKNKCIYGLHSFLNSPFWRSVQLVDATLQAGDLIDQVDRQRGANKNQSRGIQMIHAKRLTHHPNTRYTLLVMDSCIHEVRGATRIPWNNTRGTCH